MHRLHIRQALTLEVGASDCAAGMSARQSERATPVSEPLTTMPCHTQLRTGVVMELTWADTNGGPLVLVPEAAKSC